MRRVLLVSLTLAPATWRKLIDMCVDGTMTSRPRALERVLSEHTRPASCG
jgi:hypothetical protein